jgi:hypothetical protein
LAIYLKTPNCYNMEQELIDKLLFLARKKSLYDFGEDVCVFDYSGSNVDDAYEMGERDGQTELARELLKSIGINYKE